jgi:hypothetical protein
MFSDRRSFCGGLGVLADISGLWVARRGRRGGGLPVRPASPVQSPFGGDHGVQRPQGRSCSRATAPATARAPLRPTRPRHSVPHVGRRHGDHPASLQRATRRRRRAAGRRADPGRKRQLGRATWGPVFRVTVEVHYKLRHPFKGEGTWPYGPVVRVKRRVSQRHDALRRRQMAASTA